MDSQPRIRKELCNKEIILNVKIIITGPENSQKYVRCMEQVSQMKNAREVRDILAYCSLGHVQVIGNSDG